MPPDTVIERFDVPTGGAPEHVIGAALRRFKVVDGGLYRLTIHHDATCPCVTRDQPLRACTCEIVHVERSQLA